MDAAIIRFEKTLPLEIFQKVLAANNNLSSNALKFDAGYFWPSSMVLWQFSSFKNCYPDICFQHNGSYSIRVFKFWNTSYRGTMRRLGRQCSYGCVGSPFKGNKSNSLIVLCGTPDVMSKDSWLHKDNGYPASQRRMSRGSTCCRSYVYSFSVLLI